jgi:hypothetical protein
MYNYLDVVPEVTTSILDRFFFNTENKKPIAVKAGKDNRRQFTIRITGNWSVSPHPFPSF